LSQILSGCFGETLSAVLKIDIKILLLVSSHPKVKV